MDEKFRPDWHTTNEELAEYDRLQEQEVNKWIAEENERIAREERNETAARAADPLTLQLDDPE